MAEILFRIQYIESQAEIMKYVERGCVRTILPRLRRYD